MSDTPIVFDEWNTYPAERDGVPMFISYDVALSRGELPADLGLCARVMIPVRAPNDAGGPVEPESSRLYGMEDALVARLEEHQVRCRLAGRLTYDGLREIVFQLRDWESFRPPVGLWMRDNPDYEIDVSEHEGWDFFDSYLRPDLEDELFMADRSVVEKLIESGSDPAKEHALEYVFTGDADGLKRLAELVIPRGYHAVGNLDPSSGEIVLAKPMTLDLREIVAESLSNHELAEQAGVDCNGWGAMIVE